jgi:hypothetical protein
MRHFIVKMISTSTEKEEEHGGELIGTDGNEDSSVLPGHPFSFLCLPNISTHFHIPEKKS